MDAAGEVAARHPALHRASLPLARRIGHRHRRLVRNPVHRPIPKRDLYVRRGCPAVVPARRRLRISVGDRQVPAVQPGRLMDPVYDGHDSRPPNHPPPWSVHNAWRAHRALNRLSGGRFLWTTSNKRGWGALRLTTIGRKSGQERSVIIGYLEDGPNLVAIAMNGWDEGHPAWWRNLEAHPDAVIQLPHQPPSLVRARPSAGEERDRLWQRWVAVDPRLDASADRRSTETPV